MDDDTGAAVKDRSVIDARLLLEKTISPGKCDNIVGCHHHLQYFPSLLAPFLLREEPTSPLIWVSGRQWRNIMVICPARPGCLLCAQGRCLAGKSATEMKSGWQKLKERREKEERAKRGRQLVTQLFANKEGGGLDPPTATTTGFHFGEGGLQSGGALLRSLHLQSSGPNCCRMGPVPRVTRTLSDVGEPRDKL
ncbi:unnamed protein product [Gadus morhua 'NCC']